MHVETSDISASEIAVGNRERLELGIKWIIKTNEDFSVVSHVSATCLPVLVPTWFDDYSVNTCFQCLPLFEKVWIAEIPLLTRVKH